MTILRQQGQAAKSAAYPLATAGTAKKNAALQAMANILTDRQAEWLQTNARDIAAAREAGMRPSLLDRLALTAERIAGIVDGIRQICALPDPIGRVDRMETRPNGLIDHQTQKRRKKGDFYGDSKTSDIKFPPVPCDKRRLKPAAR